MQTKPSTVGTRKVFSTEDFRNSRGSPTITTGAKRAYYDDMIFMEGFSCSAIIIADKFSGFPRGFGCSGVENNAREGK
jgi:hypothetical protein